MNMNIDPKINVKLGYLVLKGVKVGESGAELRSVFDAKIKEAKARYGALELSEHPVVKGIRELFRGSGIDPARYRPSGEALARRILKDQGLYYVNSIVDINNICSIRSLFPVGSYDLEKIKGDVILRLGREDESYQGIAKSIDIAGKLATADDIGPFGSPIADSDRTKITGGTEDVLALVYAPAGTPDIEIREIVDLYESLAGHFADARSVEKGIARQ